MGGVVFEARMVYNLTQRKFIRNFVGKLGKEAEMPKKKIIKQTYLERLSMRITDWMGTPHSIVAHTVVFLSALLLIGMGVDADEVMLGLTTALSLEAIYLALFIQMTVNRHSKSLQEVEKDIDEIQEDVEAIEDIQEDVEVLSEDMAEDEAQDKKMNRSLETIEQQMQQLANGLRTVASEISTLKMGMNSRERTA